MTKQIVGRIFLMATLFFFSCHLEKQKEARPQLKDITESVYASVTVKPKNSYFPQSLRSGIIKEVRIQEGDTVKMGQVLLRIAPSSEITSTLTDAKLNLAKARTDLLGKDNLLQNIMSETEAISKQLTLDSLNHRRQEKLWAQNIGSKLELERAKLAFEKSLSQYEILKKRYAQTNYDLENNLDKAQNQVRSAQAQLGDFEVYAKMYGRVYDVSKDEGDLITSQEPFAEIGDLDHFMVELYVDEVDISKISLGDTAVISLEAYANAVFKAKITSIAPKKNSTTQTFRLEANFIDEPPQLYFGLAGEANIIVDIRKNALIIPSEYMMSRDRVLTTEGEKKVVTGVKNLEFTEILTGIDTTVILIKQNL
jgi:multidrug efflux pump subunit AcrA (membrane-fusion protein)